MTGFSATAGQHAQEKAARGAKRRRLHHLVIGFVATAMMLTSGPQLKAQYVDSGIWLGGNVTGKLPSSMNNAKGSWRLWMDGQLRFGDDSSRFSQGIVRPGVGYALNKAWSLWAGYAYIRTDQPYARTPSTENRIWEQVSWQGVAGRTDLSSRTRLEERFNSAGSGTGVRLREMGKLIQPVGAKKIWLIAVYDEIFVNLNSTNFGANSGADRNRVFAGDLRCPDDGTGLDYSLCPNQPRSPTQGARSVRVDLREKLDHLRKTLDSLTQPRTQQREVLKGRRLTPQELGESAKEVIRISIIHFDADRPNA